MPLKIVPDNTNIGFVRLRYLAFALTLLLTLGSIGLLATRGLNLGVDFVGGLTMEVAFPKAPPLDSAARRGAEPECRRRRAAGVRRAGQHPHPPAAAAGRPGGGAARRRARPGRPQGQVRQRQLPPHRERQRQGQPRADPEGGARRPAVDGGGRAVHVVPLRMAFRRLDRRRAGPRRDGDARLLRADAARVRSSTSSPRS